jgi:replicative superfamily II helicase
LSPSTASPVSHSDAVEDARLLGRLEAERFDAALRERELQEREDRLTRLAAGDETAVEPVLNLSGEGGTMETWRLRQDVERLAAFHHAVLHSKSWRLVQVARRLVGRGW